MAKRQELEAQISRLEAQVNELGGKLEEYRHKEQAIVNALTQAQSAAAKSVADAQEQAKAIIAEAESQRVAVDAQADTVIRDAENRAEEIVSSAKQEAATLVANTQETIRGVDRQLVSLNEALKTTAEQARAQAETFANTIEALQMGSGQAAVEGQGAAAYEEENPAYASPGELMRGIYQLQGREIPEEVRLGTMHELSADHAPEQFESEQPKAYESVLPPFDPAAFQTKEQPQTEEPLNGVPPVQKEESEERIWTVNEVMRAAPAAQPASAATPSLDHLLDDIINEPKAQPRPQPPVDKAGHVDLDGLLDEILSE